MEGDVRKSMRKALYDIGNFNKNLIFTEELFLEVYNIMRQRYSIYQELADMNDLYETDTEDCWSKRDSVGYYRLSKMGFIDKRADKYLKHA